MASADRPRVAPEQLAGDLPADIVLSEPFFSTSIVLRRIAISLR
jgi:hypothetical protein